MSTPRMRPVRFVGTFPPPHHGMAIATASLADALEQRGVHLERVDVADADPSTPRAKTHKAIRTLRAGLGLAISPPRALLVGADAGLGSLLQLWLVWAARLRRVPTFVFHHSTVVPLGSTRTGRWFVHLGGSRLVHVVLCGLLEQRMRERHTGRRMRRTFVMSNGHVFRDADHDRGPAAPPDQGHDTVSAPLRVGHLSNLRVDKGFAVVGGAVERLAATGVDVEFHLAGGAADDEARSALAQLRGRLGPRLIEYGFVDGADKDRFFASIDVFAFPSTYVNECSPLVVWEAMHAGIPIVASAVGCLGDPTLAPAVSLLPDDADADAVAAAILDAHRGRDADAVRAVALDDVGVAETALSELVARIDDAHPFASSPTGRALPLRT